MTFNIKKTIKYWIEGAEYTDFNIEDRYPDQKNNFYSYCTKKFAKEKFKEMETLYKWLKKESKL